MSNTQVLECFGIAREDICCNVFEDFKYLDSKMSYNVDMRDDLNIDAKIITASKSMGAPKNFWDNAQVYTHSKDLIFRAISLTLLLWVCVSFINRIEVFLGCSCRRILHITTWCE